MPSDFNSLDGTLPTPGAGRLWFLAGRSGSWRPRALQRAKIPARAGCPQRRSSNANSLWWRVWPGSTRVVTSFQIHGLRPDSGVRVLRPSHAVVSFAVKRRPVGHEALGFNVRHYVPIRAAPKGAQSAPMLTFIEENAQAGVFLPEDVRILVAAFDDAWARLLRLRTSPCSAILCVRNRACSLVLGSLEQMELDETGDSRSIGMPGRNQSESVVAITRCAHAYQISPMFGYLPNIFLCRITRQTKVLKSSERDVLCRRCHYQCLAPPCHGSRIGAQ
jgi:hypothetical protein